MTEMIDEGLHIPLPTTQAHSDAERAHNDAQKALAESTAAHLTSEFCCFPLFHLQETFRKHQDEDIVIHTRIFSRLDWILGMMIALEGSLVIALVAYVLTHK